VHLVGFIIRIYHDPRSPERQIFQSFRLNSSSTKYDVIVTAFQRGIYRCEFKIAVRQYRSAVSMQQAHKQIFLFVPSL